MSDKTGGPAFPHIDSGCGRFEEGMTLRDYFAAKAMQAQVSCFPVGEEYSALGVANVAYVIADAMLKARNE